jgi:transposase
MKKNSIFERDSRKKKKGAKAAEISEQELIAKIEELRRERGAALRLTMGIDLGDRFSCYCVLDEDGNVIGRGQVMTEPKALEALLGKLPASVVALEVGTHSPWVSRLLERLGHDAIVANARRVKLISESSRKHDRLDAEMLARLARADRKLLSPVRHRSEQGQADLMGIRVRSQLVELRTQAVNAARGLVKSFGQRLAKCDADSLRESHAAELEPAIKAPIERLLRVVQQLTEEIAGSETELEKLSAERYGEETRRLKQVSGVGPITSLAFVLTLEDASRFKHSRDVGCYLGMRPKRDDSGESQPELRISKEGDVYLRKLLVQCAQHILSQRGPDSDLKQWGLQIAAKGKKKAKRRALVAVARKLAILLHRLWVGGQPYEPHRRVQKAAQAAAA